MIGFETARAIAFAYREVEVAEKLLAEISDTIGRRTAPDIRDAFGRHVGGLELGIPSGDNGRRLFNVPWELARPVIEAHIAQQKAIIASLRAELESLFGNMYAGWDRGVVVTQERFADGETRFSERPMTSMELAARYVAAEIGANIFEIANRAAFAPIVTFSQIQAHIGPVFEGMAAEIDRLKADLARTARNRDMWKGQCERQAEQLTACRRPEGQQ